MKKELNLNDPKDAKYFLTKVMPTVIKKPFSEFKYDTGKAVKIKDMTDDQLVEAALWCAPIFQAAHPEQIEINHEQ